VISNAHEIKGVARIIDANINRLKEALRVCEEISRFILESRSLSSGLKKIRHGLDRLIRELSQKRRFIDARDSRGDIGRGISVNEFKRKDYRDILQANLQRAKESLRVLEEFSKLINKNTALRFKTLRYRLYEIEKEAAWRIISLRGHR
jgi:thiamine-phosphate pyrophosphorylase